MKKSELDIISESISSFLNEESDSSKDKGEHTCGCKESRSKKKSVKKAISEDSSFDEFNMRSKGREHAQRIKQLQRTIDHAERLAGKHFDYAFLHDEIGEDPSHPKHVDPSHHQQKYDKHMKKSKMLKMYVKSFRDAMEE